MKERLNYIDWLKGIAIITVVMGHVTAFDFLSLTDSSKSFVNRFIVSLQMPLFIFLSGLVVAYSGGYPFSISGDIRSVPS
ncbi:acyltransferase family protein [Phocaeicola plebeius]|uniref:acyltransferase family protein n=1 Tax=Phocaeicola plebeius TaxID=310297 RepID=UPI0035618903